MEIWLFGLRKAWATSWLRLVALERYVFLCLTSFKQHPFTLVYRALPIFNSIQLFTEWFTEIKINFLLFFFLLFWIAARAQFKLQRTKFNQQSSCIQESGTHCCSPEIGISQDGQISQSQFKFNSVKRWSATDMIIKRRHEKEKTKSSEFRNIHR